MTTSNRPADIRGDFDARLDALERWLGTALPAERFTLAPASADASFRRYFRVTLADDRTLIAMDAPPEREDCRAFVNVARLMLAAGLNVPVIRAEDIELGFLLLSDLGPTTYLAALKPDNAQALMSDAIDALIRWQGATRAGVLPAYDAPLLEREMGLFEDWYVARHLGTALTPAESTALSTLRARLTARALAQAKVYVHRDYMPRNLMLSEPNPGILDFQDAVEGPITYDLVSLCRDAFVSWPEETVIDWCARYWERARDAELPVPADFAAFYEDFEWMGLQRHLKVLGIFARINYRDGKPHYLVDTSRFVGYARAVARRYAALAPLARLLDRLEPLTPVPAART